MIAGLSAFPLTPFVDEEIDEASFAGLVTRLATAGVDSITVLGSTGSYAYLRRAERQRIAELGVAHAGSVPVLAGIGGLRTRHVLEHAEDAQRAGVAGLLLAPVSYQPLTENDVFELFRAVSREVSVPVIVYDNPGTTHFRFTPELFARIAELPHIASIKVPGVPASAPASPPVFSPGFLPGTVTVGVAGDAFAAEGLAAGCVTWYSVLGGTLPGPALAITRAAQAGDHAGAAALSARLQPLWDLNAAYGSLRVIAAVAEHLGLVRRSSLPLPIQGLDDAARAEVVRVVTDLDLVASVSTASARSVPGGDSGGLLP
ncbi:dihydrodipicolinate synthase family protein [Actinoplanes sp. NPDC051851]|uniref:dihydrodipicolinate synthase family protein n=1 Tax=Actinoplanes sp. NPDC051851 TaxID=3154753 RepID=UPI003414A0A2